MRCRSALGADVRFSVRKGLCEGCLGLKFRMYPARVYSVQGFADSDSPGFQFVAYDATEA